MTDWRDRIAAIAAEMKLYERDAAYPFALRIEAVLRDRPTDQWPGQLEHEVAGALRSCIDAHGPITKQWIGSAAKRIVKSCALEREP